VDTDGLTPLHTAQISRLHEGLKKNTEYETVKQAPHDFYCIYYINLFIFN